MKIRISDGKGNDLVYTLNDSEPAHALQRMLPAEFGLTDYRAGVKGFTPQKKLNVFGAPLAGTGDEVLVYYRPWNMVFMVQGGYKPEDELYVLGYPESGQGQLRNLKGNIRIEEII